MSIQLQKLAEKAEQADMAAIREIGLCLILFSFETIGPVFGK
jgi:hypothetical protein